MKKPYICLKLFTFATLFSLLLSACGSTGFEHLESLKDQDHKAWIPILSVGQSVSSSENSELQLGILNAIELQQQDESSQNTRLILKARASLELIESRNSMKLDVMQAELDCLYQTIILESRDTQTGDEIRLALKQDYIESDEFSLEQVKGIPHLFETNLNLEAICQPIMKELLEIEVHEKGQDVSYDAYTFSRLYPKDYQTIAMLFQHQNLTMRPSQAQGWGCTAAMLHNNWWTVSCEFAGHGCLTVGSGLWIYSLLTWCW